MQDEQQNPPQALPQATMTDDDLALTESAEGESLASYQDVAGVWTIGYGHTGPGVGPGQTCTDEQAQAWLAGDLQSAEQAVREFVTVPLTQAQFDALTDFVFNVGAGAFESSTLLRLLNSGDYAGADAQFARWNLSAGHVYAGLVARRAAEASLFASSAPAAPSPASGVASDGTQNASAGPAVSSSA